MGHQFSKTQFLHCFYRVRRIRHKRAMRRAKLERLRRQRELAQQQAQANPSVPGVPGVEHYTEEDVPAEAPLSPQDKSDRDYFEEFFKGK